jgi:hypothetical protein
LRNALGRGRGRQPPRPGGHFSTDPD